MQHSHNKTRNRLINTSYSTGQNGGATEQAGDRFPLIKLKNHFEYLGSVWKECESEKKENKYNDIFSFVWLKKKKADFNK